MKAKKRPNTPAAMLRVRQALQHIGAAQGELARASAHLATLRYGADHCEKLGELYEKMKTQWYALREFSESPQSLSVDSEIEPTDEP